jgi:hypothetical protein
MRTWRCFHTGWTGDPESGARVQVRPAAGFSIGRSSFTMDERETSWRLHIREAEGHDMKSEILGAQIGMQVVEMVRTFLIREEPGPYHIRLLTPSERAGSGGHFLDKLTQASRETLQGVVAALTEHVLRYDPACEIDLHPLGDDLQRHLREAPLPEELQFVLTPRR